MVGTKVGVVAVRPIDGAVMKVDGAENKMAAIYVVKVTIVGVPVGWMV